MRSSIRRSTPGMGDGVQSSLDAWTAAGALKSELRFTSGPHFCSSGNRGERGTKHPPATIQHKGLRIRPSSTITDLTVRPEEEFMALTGPPGLSYSLDASLADFLLHHPGESSASSGFFFRSYASNYRSVFTARVTP